MKILHRFSFYLKYFDNHSYYKDKIKIPYLLYMHCRILTTLGLQFICLYLYTLWLKAVIQPQCIYFTLGQHLTFLFSSTYSLSSHCLAVQNPHASKFPEGKYHLLIVKLLKHCNHSENTGWFTGYLFLIFVLSLVQMRIFIIFII